MVETGAQTLVVHQLLGFEGHTTIESAVHYQHAIQNPIHTNYVIDLLFKISAYVKYNIFIHTSVLYAYKCPLCIVYMQSYWCLEKSQGLKDQ